jgi:hypothetical protein
MTIRREQVREAETFQSSPTDLPFANMPFFFSEGEGK